MKGPVPTGFGFEKRNGSLIFGGGQVLIPLLFTELVEFKEWLTSEEFISGYALVQAVPGPTFSFAAYLGALIMSDLGTGGQILGGLLAAAGIFLPGTFLIFFVLFAFLLTFITFSIFTLTIFIPIFGIYTRHLFLHVI